MTDTELIGRLEHELREISGVILRTSMEGCELIRSGATLSAINTVVDFLRTLFRRRDIILHELKKAGGSERESVRRMGGQNPTSGEDNPTGAYAPPPFTQGRQGDGEGGA